MTAALVVVSVVVVGGAVLAMGAREPRLAVLGLLVALLGAAYVSEPLPGAIAVGGRLVGTVLGGYLLWIALRGTPGEVQGASIGWPGAIAIAIAGYTAGWLAATAAGVALGVTPGEGPSAGLVAEALVAGSPVARAAMGAAFALLVLAMGPILVARDVLRLGLGLLLLLVAADLARASLGGPAGDPVDLVLGLAIAAGAAGLASITARSLRTHGDLLLRPASARETPVRSRPVDDAHPAGRA